MQGHVISDQDALDKGKEVAEVKLAAGANEPPSRSAYTQGRRDAMQELSERAQEFIQQVHEEPLTEPSEIITRMFARPSLGADRDGPIPDLMIFD